MQQQLLDYITLGIGSLAAPVIIWGIILGIVELVKEEWRRVKTGKGNPGAFEKIRYEIGSHLLLGLEFLIAADIIRSIANPSLEELAVLGGIVAIRTVLSYFLAKEINQWK